MQTQRRTWPREEVIREWFGAYARRQRGVVALRLCPNGTIGEAQLFPREVYVFMKKSRFSKGLDVFMKRKLHIDHNKVDTRTTNGLYINLACVPHG